MKSSPTRLAPALAPMLAALLSASTRPASAFSPQAPTRFQFREPEPTTYFFSPPSVSGQRDAASDPDWLPAQRDDGNTNQFYLGARVVLRLAPGQSLPDFIAGRPLTLSRAISSNLFILQAPTPLTAASEAARLATLDGIDLAHPVRRRPIHLFRRRPIYPYPPYATPPNDPLFPWQWHLENRNTNTTARLGPDLNIRAAWPDNRGEAITVAVADNGVEIAHPDLAAGMTNAHHFNFVSGIANGNHASSSQAHGTCVAGLIAARSGNNLGVCGIAPQAQIASWVIFDPYDGLASEEAVMDAFQYRSNIVSVQNHSWGNASVQRLPVSALETHGLDNALAYGRNGRGVVFVRAAGNQRTYGNDLNDDGYGQDPRVIAVGAVRANGRATSYTTPGASVLVAAFSADANVDRGNGTLTNYPALTTTDRQGSLGYNTASSASLGNYAHGASGFSGTSGATPQITGLCALILAANPTLTYRDVQAVLILAARQLDLADPGFKSNAAAFAFSHSAGFGVPDAALAIRIARAWPNLPPLTTVTATNRSTAAIPDDGLRLRITGPNVPTSLVSIPASPSDGLHPDDPTPALPLTNVGQALAPIATDLTGRAALIQRGVNYFVEKIRYAAAAGASFAIVYNNVGTTERITMSGADIQFEPVPAISISRTSGEALRSYLLTQPTAQAQINLDAATFNLEITNTLRCEFARLHLRAFHPRRSDIRITLLSPAGTRSVLHHLNQDTTSNLGEWDYFTRAPFGESSAGTWTVEVSDEVSGSTGSVTAIDLTLAGVPILDVDCDGLDDDWERLCFGSLAARPTDDPDGDGFPNSREAVLGWHPLVSNRPLQITIAPWNPQRLRLSWPASPGFHYELLTFPEANSPPTAVTPFPGTFPEIDCLIPTTVTPRQFYQIRQYPVLPASP